MPSLPHKGTLTTQISIPMTLRYLLYLPKNYDPQERWPLVLYLHSSSERGNDLDQVKCYGLPKLIEDGQDFPFLVVAPHCLKSELWSSKAQIATLATLVDEIARDYAVDSDRIYVTGISMGGYGTWLLANAYPQKFAAIVPLCGGGRPETICAIRHVPVWAFHGAKDTDIPLESTQMLVDTLKACGGNVKLTIYPDAGHDIWMETYINPEIYTWLLQQRRVAEPNGEGSASLSI